MASPLQQRFWRWQRVGWAVMALLVVLALAGTFGDGVMSHEHITFADGSTIALNGVMRSDNPERVLFTGTAPGATVTLALDSATLRWLEIVLSVPDAIAERRGVERLEMDIVPTSDGTISVELVMRPHSIGIHRLRTKLGDGAWRDVRVIVLP